MAKTTTKTQTSPPSLASETKPDIWSEEWTQYVLEQLRSDEVDKDGNPLNKGLYRLVNLLIGKTLDRQIIFAGWPGENNGLHAGIARRVRVRHHDTGEIYDYDDAADVYSGNCRSPYNQHSSSTASTKAESRIFRKILNLNIISAEEATEIPESESGIDGLITPTQLLHLNVLMKRYNINGMKYINSGKFEYTHPSKIQYATAQKMGKDLNDLGQAPEKIKLRGVEGYDPNWMKTPL